ncbi:MAG: hypothetical protein HC772_10050 [Leptolyngbyaceae cyanobacterium CRU_2_3]|nr:hypothetical protein [Leptolyngbyaceae cyanobacterium CRU_2_3]
MKNQWQRYKSLELIPDSAPEPKLNMRSDLSPLVGFWCTFINLLVREHLCEQRTDYLERCWLMNYEEPYTATSTDQLQKLWELMN